MSRSPIPARNPFTDRSQGGIDRLRPTERARLALVASVIVTVLLYVVPYGYMLAYPLMLLSTLVHEMGHGVAALLVGGSFHQFQMWVDGSGVAMWSAEPSRWRLAVVAAGGQAALLAPRFAHGFHQHRGQHARVADIAWPQAP